MGTRCVGPDKEVSQADLNKPTVPSQTARTACAAHASLQVPKQTPGWGAEDGGCLLHKGGEGAAEICVSQETKRGSWTKGNPVPCQQ